MAAEFEWDDAKDASDLAKHGISFDEAIEVFADRGLAVVPTIREVDREHRFKAIGRIGGRLVTVVDTERSDAKRIISARRANATEERRYGDRSSHA